jgi:hypothetical protein
VLETQKALEDLERLGFTGDSSKSVLATKPIPLTSDEQKRDYDAVF